MCSQVRRTGLEYGEMQIPQLSPLVVEALVGTSPVDRNSVRVGMFADIG